MALKQLKPHHYVAINYLSQVNHAGKTMEQIAEECGVHRTTLYAWKEDPLFETELKKAMMRTTLDKMPDILESVPQHIIDKGNAAMFKTLLQALGMLTEHHAITDTRDTNGPSIEDMRRELAEKRDKAGDK